MYRLLKNTLIAFTLLCINNNCGCKKPIGSIKLDENCQVAESDLSITSITSKYQFCLKASFKLQALQNPVEVQKIQAGYVCVQESQLNQLPQDPAERAQKLKELIQSKIPSTLGVQEITTETCKLLFVMFQEKKSGVVSQGDSFSSEGTPLIDEQKLLALGTTYKACPFLILDGSIIHIESIERDLQVPLRSELGLPDDVSASVLTLTKVHEKPVADYSNYPIKVAFHDIQGEVNIPGFDKNKDKVYLVYIKESSLVTKEELLKKLHEEGQLSDQPYADKAKEVIAIDILNKVSDERKINIPVIADSEVVGTENVVKELDLFEKGAKYNVCLMSKYLSKDEKFTLVYKSENEIPITTPAFIVIKMGRVFLTELKSSSSGENDNQTSIGILFKNSKIISNENNPSKIELFYVFLKQNDDGTQVEIRKKMTDSAGDEKKQLIAAQKINLGEEKEFTKQDLTSGLTIITYKLSPNLCVKVGTDESPQKLEEIEAKGESKTGEDKYKGFEPGKKYDVYLCANLGGVTFVSENSVTLEILKEPDLTQGTIRALTQIFNRAEESAVSLRSSGVKISDDYIPYLKVKKDSTNILNLFDQDHTNVYNQAIHPCKVYNGDKRYYPVCDRLRAPYILSNTQGFILSHFKGDEIIKDFYLNRFSLLLEDLLKPEGPSKIEGYLGLSKKKKDTTESKDKEKNPDVYFEKKIEFELPRAFMTQDEKNKIYLLQGRVGMNVPTNHLFKSKSKDCQDYLYSFDVVKEGDEEFNIFLHELEEYNFLDNPSWKVATTWKWNSLKEEVKIVKDFGKGEDKSDDINFRNKGRAVIKDFFDDYLVSYKESLNLTREEIQDLINKDIRSEEHQIVFEPMDVESFMENPDK